MQEQIHHLSGGITPTGAVASPGALQQNDIANRLYKLETRLHATSSLARSALVTHSGCEASGCTIEVGFNDANGY